MNQPVLYLDVDGVLNVIGGARTWPDIRIHSVRTANGISYQMYLSREMGSALQSLDVQIRWATTWADEANKQVAPLIGLPTDLPVACRPDISDSPFKFIAIKAEVERERLPFIWIDDEAITEIDMAWGKMLGIPHLFIEPNPRRGLTPEHIELIRDFVESLSEPAA